MASSVLAFLSELAERDIRLWLEDGQLRFSAPEGGFTPEIKDQVLARKADIVSFLAGAQEYADQKIEARTRQDGLPLSFAQQRLWLLDQLGPGSPTYNVPAAFTLEGALDAEKLKRSFEILIERHESLRTYFVLSAGRPEQKIVNIEECLSDWWSLEDLSEGSPNVSHNIFHYIQDHAQYRFDLEQAPLLRVEVLRKSESESVLLLNMHHIISDAQSVSIFLSELSAIYSSLEQGALPQFPNLEIQYADYALWQREYLNEDNIQKELNYWKGVLHGGESLQLPLDKDRPAIFTERGGAYHFDFDQELSQNLNKLAEQQGATLFMFCLAIYQVFLSRYSAQRDISVGTPISNRSLSELEGLIGFFGNTLVLRNQIDTKQSFNEFLKQVERNTLDAFSHQDIPFEMLVDELVSERDMSSSPLFQSMFTLTQNESVNNYDIKLGSSLKVQLLEQEQLSSKYDFSLSINFDGETISASIEYCSDLFYPETIKQMAQHFEKLSRLVANDLNSPIAEYRLIEGEELQEQLINWNQSKADYPKQSLPQLIEQRVAEHGDRLALIFEDKEFSYQELGNRSNALAAYFQAQGLKPGDGAAVLLDRSENLLFSLLAILKCGAYYIPVDPEYPQDRIDYVLEHSEPKLIISENKQSEKIIGQIETILLDSFDFDRLSSSLDVEANQKDSAYVIYTSGSTGLPKGVEISHGALANFLQAMKDTLAFSEEDRFLALTSLSFDIAGLELWAPLMFGSSLVLASKDSAADQDFLSELIDQNEVSLIQATPATWQMLLAGNWKPQTKIKALCGGEALPISLAKKLLSLDLELFNMYGPTETTIWSACKKITLDDEKILIGKPINNTQLYVLDENYQALPRGAVGELFIAGNGLAEGYFKQAELSAERFVANPFYGQDPDTSKRMYHTGDLARWTATGELECLGRIDSQVKVRGFRIELGEIENVSLLLNEVDEAAVVVKSIHGEKHICAYYVSESNKNLDESNEELRNLIKAQLAQKLPAYMMPTRISFLEALPLTPNGKVDRKALPEPSAQQKPFAAPENKRQELIREVWQEVLKLDSISIDDNFFELGGQSLLATQSMSRLRETLELDLPLRILFENPSIRALDSAIVFYLETKHTQIELPALLPQERGEKIPLSLMQTRLWFLHQLNPDTSAYHIPMVLRLKGDVDKLKLEASFQSLIARHEILRTRFLADEGKPYQKILSESELHQDSWSLDFQKAEQSDLNELIYKIGSGPFNLSEDYLLRVSLIEIGKDRHVLVMVMHHIISDAWSFDILIKEVLSNYAGQAESLPALPLQYADYSLWQQSQIDANLLEPQFDYWKQYLARTPVLQMPLDKPRPLESQNKGSSVKINIDKDLSAKINNFSQQQGLSLFMTLMAAYQILLARYSGQNDFAVGTPIANREQSELEPLIGFFVNTLAVRSELKEEQNFVELGQALKQSLLASYQHQSLPFELLVDELAKEGLERSLSHSPVFQVMLVLNGQTTALAQERNNRVGDIEIEPYSIERNTSKFDLSLELNESDEGIVGELEFNTDLFEAETIEAMGKHFVRLLQSLVLEPSTNIYKLALLTKPEQDQQLGSWHGPAENFADDLCLHTQFESQVETTPEALALIHSGQSLTYQALNERANQVAHYLIGQGVKPGDVVGLCLPPSADLIVGLFGILKAGGTYLPMDVQYPDERLAYFIQDSSVPFVLCHNSEVTRLPKGQCSYLALDTLDSELASQSKANPGLTLDPNQHLYVIYTSGSTGQPNCTATTHAKEANLLQWYQGIGEGKGEGMSASDKVLLVSAIGFDLTQKNFFAPLLKGASLVIPSYSHYDADNLVELINDQNITWINCAPSAFYPLVESSELKSLRYVFLGGEPIALPRLQPWYQNSACTLVNSYGPTECTDVSHYHLIAKDHQDAALPIGRCIQNVKHYVLDEHLQLLPKGAVGELYLSGVSQGPGYLNNPELTQERFIENPHVPGERLYKTGDLVRFREAGQLEYLGRRDFQVKIRGVRIELAEIEQALLEQQEIKACSVIVRNAQEDNLPGDDYLAAYLVAEAGQSIDKNQIKQAISSKLPRFMQPRAWVVMDELPLTPNGKVDRKQLPIPELERKEYKAPETETEKTLAGIWQEVLGVEKVGTQDNFFELGGHSLLATRVIAKVRSSFEKDLPLAQIFSCEDLASLAKALDAQTQSSGTQGLEVQDYSLPHKLSFGQERLWVLEQLSPGSSAYHMPAVIDLSGDLNVENFEASIRSLITQQALLRTKIIEQDSEPRQIIEPSSDVVWQSSVYQYLELELYEDTIQELLFKPFDFAQDYLFRIALIKRGQDQYSLAFVLHHIIADGWSVDVLLQNLMSIYTAYEQKLDASSVEEQHKLSYQYVDYAKAQRDFLAGKDQDEAQTFWSKQLGEVSALDLPTDYLKQNLSDSNSSKGARYSFGFGSELSKTIDAWSKNHRASKFQILFSAYQILLSRLSAQKDFAVGTPVANRDQEGLENILGFFVNTLALPANLESDHSFLTVVENLKRLSAQAYEHQWLPFELVVDGLGLDRSSDRSPVFQAMFVLQENAFADSSGTIGQHSKITLSPSDFQSKQIDNKFELTLELSESKDGFLANFEYDKTLFSKQSIERYSQYFVYLLNGLLKHSDQSVFSLPLEPEQQTHNDLLAFNNNYRDYPRDLALIDIFESNIARRKDALAIKDDDGKVSLTYLELDQLANAFAQQLKAKGIKTQDRVALYFERGIDFVVAILACHKVSAVYVPINPDYPDDRREYILRDSASSALIYETAARKTAEQDKKSLPDLNLIALDKSVSPLEQGPEREQQAASSCAAILYTSGSTGEPKGVMLTHRGIARLLINTNYFSVDESDCFPMINNICFDASSYEIWGSLLNGAHLVVFPPEVVLSPERFKEANRIHNATSMLVPTGLFHNTVAENPSTFLGVKFLLIGGEAVDIELAHQVLDHSKPEHFINVYGPTENATITTTWEIGGIRRFGQKVNIGAPTANTSVYIVDEELRLQPVGVPGELLCAGDGLSLGYQNPNTPNQKNFIEHPFLDLEHQKTPGEEKLQAYRSGDIARYLANGELEFLGRKDHQVKIRGYRVEPDELAAIINGLEDIEHATVLAKRNEQSQAQALHLVAYFLPKNPELSPQDLKKQIAKVVPAYMVPSLCVPMNEIPLTPNGKIDKRALPEPNWQDMASNEYEAPIGELETLIANTWQSVLGLERIGRLDNFFEIGGNSLSATRVIAQCGQEYGQEIPLRALFDSPVLKDFCKALEESTFSSLSVIEKAPSSEASPLSYAQMSYAQQRLWFLHQLDPSAAYNVPLVLKVQGDLDIDKLRQSFVAMIERNEILRTRFIAEDDSAVQVIDSAGNYSIDFAHTELKDSNQRDRLVAHYVSEVFDLEKGPLIKLKLLQESKDEFILVLVLHHIITDAWSLELIQKEIFSSYLGLASNETPKLHYADYAHWESLPEQQQALKEGLSYWNKQLSNVPNLNLPLDKARPSIESYQGATLDVELSQGTYQKIKTLAEEQGVSSFMILLAAYQVLMARYSGQDDFAVGSPIANRNHPQVEEMQGFFVNTLALRANLSSVTSFQDMLMQLKQKVLEAYQYQQVPFELIVDNLNLDRQLDSSPVFQTMFMLNSKGFGENDTQDEGKIKLSNFEFERSFSKFDISLELNEIGDRLFGVFEYKTSLFEKRTIEKLSKHFLNLLDGLLNNTEQDIHSIALLTKPEQEQQLGSWHGPVESFIDDLCLHTQFESQVEATPDALALTHNRESLTYQALNERANQVAHYLIDQGVKPGDVVGLCLPPSTDLIVGLFSILKAGGTYLPMDVQYPDERLAYFIEDSSVPFVLCYDSELKRLPQGQCSYLALDTLDSELASQSKTNPGLTLDPNQHLYVIYTSGSTGQPNCTATTHAKEANLLQWYQGIGEGKGEGKGEGMSASDKVLLVSAIGFDLTQKNFFAPLLKGASLVIPGYSHYDADHLVELITEQEITWINCAPSAFYPLVESSELKSLRYVFLGGEPIALPRLQPWHQNSACTLVNSYGPTECTDVSHYHLIAKDHQDAALPIGRCIQNVKHYVLDEHLQLLPAGAVGELYLSGVSQGPGYLNNPELTQERFIENPHVPGERLYKTGDLVRFREAGQLEYLGRRDFQVKIRGVRIELAEIEQALLEQQEIKACSVIVRDAQEDSLPGDDYLAAYLVAEAGQSIDKNQIKQAISGKLPSFMQPRAWVVMDELPLTPNGKVDRKQLPIPELERKEYKAPETEVEKTLAAIWQDVLDLKGRGVEKVGTQDNFFELGGHSLLATRVLSKLRAELEKDIRLVKLFELPNLFELAQYIDGLSKGSVQANIPKADRNERLMLSYSQQRIWFLEQLNPGSSFYHMPAVLKLQGPFDEARFERSVQHIIQRHENLRTTFVLDESSSFDEPAQIIHDLKDWSIQHHNFVGQDLDENAMKQKAAELLLTPFDLSQGPLFRMHLVQVAEQEYYLIAVMHHIISDGWSIEVLLKEIVATYLLGEQALPALNIQYADFAQWQRNNLSELLQEQEHYWCEQLNQVPVLQMPFDRLRPALESHRGASVPFALSKELSQSLKQFSEQQGLTLFMTLMAAYQVLLARYSGQNDFAVGTPIANRNHPNLEPLIGCFINTLAIRADLEDAQLNFETLSQQVKQSTLQAFEHQDLPFEKIVDALRLERSMSHSPIFQVMLVVNNQALGQNELEHALKQVQGNDSELTVSTVEAEHVSAKFDLNMEISDQGDSIIGHLEYSTDLFDASTIDSLVENFFSLLEQLMARPQQKLVEISALSEERKLEQLTQNQGPIESFTEDLCLHQVFESQVEATPDALALTHNRESLTYQALNERANQVAHYLIDQGVKPGDVVGLCLPPSTDLIVGLFSILKAGGTYLPMDVQYPDERLAYFIEDSSVPFVLCYDSELKRLPQGQCSYLALDTLDSELASQSKTNPGLTLDPNQHLYVIYTSGSTGQPNCTATTHAKEANLLQWYQGIGEGKGEGKGEGMSASDKVLLVSAIGFDLTQKNFFAPLLKGASLVIPGYSHYDADHLVELITEQEITWINCAPSAFYPLVESSELKSLRYVFLGGEPIALPRLQPWHQNSACTLVNSYGPTECTDVSHYHLIAKDHQDAALPIGRCIQNVKHYVLDEHLQLLPAGAVGELYLSGVSQGPGYLNNPELTQERFIENPHVPGERLYKTGDLVRFREAGQLEYLGRRDFQVKIRGVRIELAEIEQALLEQQEIKACSVIVRDAQEDSLPGDDYLAAYLVAEPGQALDKNQIKQAISDKLPSFMQPRAWVVMDELPLTPNGKVDRKQLPIPELERKEYKAPETETEKTLAAIWQEVLGIEKVGTQDNFFELGGHSLLATRVVAKVRTSIDVELELRLMFELDSLEELAAYLTTLKHFSADDQEDSEDDDLEEIEL